MGKRIPDSIKQEVCQRFLAGETNISRLAKEFNLNRRTVYSILNSACPDFREVVRKTRKQNAHKRRQQQIEAKYRCREKHKIAKTEEEKMICNLFWANKCIWDELGPYTELEIAKKLNVELAKIYRVLQKDPEYKALQTKREQNMEYLMRRAHLQDTLAMSRSRKLNTAQAVLLNLSAYKLDEKKKCLVYSLAAKRPADLPRKLSLQVFIKYYHYVTGLSEQHKEKSREMDPGQKTEGGPQN